MKYLILLLCLVPFVSADTLNKRIYQIAVASPASVQNKQIGVNTSADANLGFKMWFGKDADGNVTQFLAKDKNGRVLSWRQDSSFSLRDTSKSYKGDSAYIAGMKNDRFYFGTQTGTSDIKITDSTKGIILKTKDGTARKFWRIQIDSAGAISADSTGLN